LFLHGAINHNLIIKWSIKTVPIFLLWFDLDFMITGTLIPFKIFCTFCHTNRDNINFSFKILQTIIKPIITFIVIIIDHNHHSIQCQLKLFISTFGGLRGLVVACWTDHYHPCSNLGVGISEGCFIFDFASLLLEITRPI